MELETEEVSDNGDDTTPSKMAVDGAADVAVDGRQVPLMAVEMVEDKNKSPRHPRWTRQETLTLIEGKKVAENRGRRGRKSSSVFGSDTVEPKWDSVASYCRERLVNRGPVQCRKRWSNMVGDFKKIKTWESQVKQECDSYWLMRNDLRKENKLPGFFDREVFDVLDGKSVTKAAYKLALVTVSADAKDDDLATVADDVDDENADVEADVVFDSGRRATSDDGLFQDEDKLDEEENDQSYDDATKISDPTPISVGPIKEQQTNPISWKECMSQEGGKRRRVSTNEVEHKNFDDRLIEVLEKNANMLNARFEAENANCQLDRNERKNYNDSLVTALNRISDSLAKIADKL